jgi:hypothetical protein
VTIERPLRLSAQLSDDRIATLRFAPKPFNAVMQKIYESYGKDWTETSYGQLSEDQHVEIRTLIKAEFSELKEKDIKTVLEPKLWLEQRALMRKVQSLQTKIGIAQHNDFNVFDELLKQALKNTSIKLEAKEKKQFLDAITWKNPEAEPVINKVVKAKENPLYGQFSYKGKIVEFVQDGDLRDAENIALDPTQSTTDLIESYVKREVLPHVPDAWINADKRDAQDGEIGIVGYEINFNNKMLLQDQQDQENLVRLKNIVTLDAEGEFVLKNNTGELILFNTVKDSKYYTLLSRFNIDKKRLNYEFYNIFINLPEGKDWLDGAFPKITNIRNIHFNNWRNLKLKIPEMKTQLEIVEFFQECNVILEKINLLKNTSLNNFEVSKEQLKPYLETVQRYENEFSSMLPTPLAILWELADAKFNDREKSEAFVKFYEYLGFYLLSILFGKHTPKKNVFYKKRYKNMDLLNMSFSYQQMEQLIKSNPDYAEHEILSYFFNYEIIDLLKKMTFLRNDIAHRGLPSASAVNNASNLVKKFNEIIQDVLRDFFSQTTLISPIQSRFDGEKYIYEVDVLKGVGVNPSKSKLIKTSIPLISNNLYLISGDMDNYENISIIEVFPILIWEETISQSEIKAFYFYSDSIQEERKLRYVCPYPNLETYKFSEWDVIQEKCRDNAT